MNESITVAKDVVRREGLRQLVAAMKAFIVLNMSLRGSLAL
jgi:hypothetical protein